MKKVINKNNILIIVASFFVATACSEQDQGAVFYQKAKTCYENQDYVCAKTALEKALEIKPEFAGAYANLGEVNLKLGRISESLCAYEKAAQLVPENPDVQVKLATLYLLNKKTDRAKKLLEKVLENHPDSQVATYLLAEFYEMEKNVDQSIQLFTKIIRSDPRQIRACLNLSALFTRKGTPEKAERCLKDALTHNPSSIHVIIALYNLYANQQKFPDALALLQNAILANPESRDLHLLLGNLYFNMARWEQSESEYLKVIQLRPRDPESYLLAANFYKTTNQPDQALAMYRQALSLQPENLGIMLHLARFHLTRENIEASLQYTHKILLQNPDFFPAKILKTESLIAKDQWDDALSYISGLIQQYPKESRLYYLKGIAHMKQNDAGRAKIEFGKIPPTSDDYNNAQLMLAGIFMAENNFVQAEEAAKTILESNKDNYAALKLLGNIYLNQNRFDEAKTYFTALTELAPQNPDGFFLLGLLNRRQKEYDNAVANFEAALARGHSDITIFANLISSLIENNMIDDAIARCDQMLQNLNEQPHSQAVVYNLKGKLHLSKNDILKAEKAFKSAMIFDAAYLPPYYSLAKIYFAEGREDNAILQYKSAIQTQSNARREMPNLMLGILFSMKNQPDLAELHYRNALAINPDFAPAANNLAYLLAEQNRNLDEALRLSQLAKSILPDDPRIQDTLGWVYVKLGFYEQAIQVFSESLRQLPDNAVIHYHLGMAYYKKGDQNHAKTALTKAFELDKNFAGFERARQVLDSLG